MTAPVRASARVLVLDPAQRLLLLGGRRWSDGRPGEVAFWYTPGGGVDDGEGLRAAAVRELAEEIGLLVPAAALEGPVWLRRHVGRWDGRDVDSRETYFVLRDVVHEVDGSGRTEDDSYGDEPHRWFTPAEVAAGGVAFAPRTLAEVLPQVLAGPWAGPPRIVD